MAYGRTFFKDGTVLWFTYHTASDCVGPQLFPSLEALEERGALPNPVLLPPPGRREHVILETEYARGFWWVGEAVRVGDDGAGRVWLMQFPDGRPAGWITRGTEPLAVGNEWGIPDSALALGPRRDGLYQPLPESFGHDPGDYEITGTGDVAADIAATMD